MFVCSGNICRSPLAHRVLEHQAKQRGLSDRISVESSGTGAWHVGQDADPRMRKTAEKNGVTLHHRAQRLQRDDLFTQDILFAMDRGHYREMTATQHRFGDGASGGNIFLFRQFDPAIAGEGIASVDEAPDVPDPYYGGARGFEDVYAIVERTCRRILDAIEKGEV